ncbi:hypothetical protein FIV42_21605 [Persicimonas caeni]|uniref:Uncharacterized protein n=1 Tax=Persicimonas caeni TaxID=2292766 RepID=A0A4Y6PZ18_PERCE|nr:hypothetical protein [Persicimonas caeni]QDG53247.1 hypothetical protein FIV42_21605 [Persicimonas caeni]QED34469.1 hypothetical protein FRD00_21600 [Persicimonas caeni]
MSLQHVFRAEQLGRCFEDAAKLERIEGEDLGSIRADSGCNLLMVYLLNRWGRLYEPRVMDELEYSDDFHHQVVRAYLNAGCDPSEEVDSTSIFDHTPMSFRVHMEEPFERPEFEVISAADLMQFLAADFHPELNPSVHEQIVRVAETLGAPS